MAMPEAAPRSLRLRVMALTLAVVTLGWLVAAGFAYVRVRHEADELLDGYLVQTASILHAQLTGGLDESELEHAPELHRYARRMMFQVWEDGARLRLHSASAPDTRLSPHDEGFDEILLGGRRFRVFSSYDRDRRTVVQVAEARRERDEIAGGVARSLFLPLGIALPALAALLWLSIGTGMRPLRVLSREIAARHPENLARVPDAGAPREIAPLVGSLNRLLERVRASLERERRFTDDAAHELRTPIAALRVQAQVAHDARCEAERALALERVLEGCDRSARLVDQMLTLARLDPLAGLAPGATCDLADLARAAMAERAQDAVDRGIEVGFDGASAIVRGDAPLLATLLRNLVDNALRHAPRGGAVCVTTRVHADGRVELVVADDGPGLPADAYSRLGERFFRPLGDVASGSGLGLSIVRRIAELHGAEVRFGPGPGNVGLEVRVALPARGTS